MKVAAIKLILLLTYLLCSGDGEANNSGQESTLILPYLKNKLKKRRKEHERIVTRPIYMYNDSRKVTRFFEDELSELRDQISNTRGKIKSFAKENSHEDEASSSEEKSHESGASSSED